MNRLQNFILLIWTLALLLFVAFNWSLVFRVVDVTYLFMDFKVQLILWLVLLGLGIPLLLRVAGGMGAKTRDKKAEKEIHSVKSQAFDGMSSEFERLGSQLQERLVNRVETVLTERAAMPLAPPAAAPGAGGGPGEEPEQPTSENGGDKKADEETKPKKGKKK